MEKQIELLRARLRMAETREQQLRQQVAHLTGRLQESETRRGEEKQQHALDLATQKKHFDQAMATFLRKHGTGNFGESQFRAEMRLRRAAAELKQRVRQVLAAARHAVDAAELLEDAELGTIGDKDATRRYYDRIRGDNPVGVPKEDAAESAMMLGLLGQ